MKRCIDGLVKRDEDIESLKTFSACERMRKSEAGERTARTDHGRGFCPRRVERGRIAQSRYFKVCEDPRASSDRIEQ